MNWFTHWVAGPSVITIRFSRDNVGAWMRLGRSFVLPRWSLRWSADGRHFPVRVRS